MVSKSSLLGQEVPIPILGCIENVGAAHLPGMVAAMTPLPVVGVPVKATHLDGLDSLLSIVQMPVPPLLENLLIFILAWDPRGYSGHQ